MEAAGGIGGLLAVCDPNDPCDPADTVGDFVYTYEANGNVGQLIGLTPTSWNASTVMVARYEYDPYGKVTQSAGSYAAANPFRFSTKWFDAETGFGYWGERYYWPELGRWLNRDPIEEAGGVNLYFYCFNDPVDHYDWLGTCVIGPGYNTCETTRCPRTPAEDWEGTVGIAGECIKRMPVPGPIKKAATGYINTGKIIIQVGQHLDTCQAAEEALRQYAESTPPPPAESRGVNMSHGGTTCAIKCQCSGRMVKGVKVFCLGRDTDKTNPWKWCSGAGSNHCPRYCRWKFNELSSRNKAPSNFVSANLSREVYGLFGPDSAEAEARRMRGLDPLCE